MVSAYGTREAREGERVKRKRREEGWERARERGGSVYILYDILYVE